MHVAAADQAALARQAAPARDAAPGRLVVSWPATLLPGMALVAMLMGGLSTESASDERPAGRAVVELEVSR